MEKATSLGYLPPTLAVIGNLLLCWKTIQININISDTID